MKAMILAAGRGSRMKSLTDHTPKPLLTVNNQTLIDHQLESLVSAGFRDIVINTGYLGQQIIEHCQDGKRYHPDVSIHYSVEPEEALDTGGGVKKALELLGTEPFLLTNADVYTDFDYQALSQQTTETAHLVLVDTPTFKSKGDFSLNHAQATNGDGLTFAGISLINPVIFEQQPQGRYSIVPIFRALAERHQLTAEHYAGLWLDVGTAERLQHANDLAASSNSERSS